MKKVLFIIPTDQFSDTEQKILHLLSRLKDQAEVSVIFLHENILKQRLTSLGISCYSASNYNALTQFIQVNYFDVIHFYGPKEILQSIGGSVPSYTKLIEFVFSDTKEFGERDKVAHTIFESEDLEQKFPKCLSSVVTFGLNPSLLMKEDKQVLRAKYNVPLNSKVIGVINKKITDINPIIMLATKLRDKKQPFKMVLFCTDDVKKILSNKIRTMNLESFLVADTLETNIPLGLFDIYFDMAGGDSLRLDVLQSLCYKTPLILKETNSHKQLLQSAPFGYLYRDISQVDLIEKYINSTHLIKKQNILMPVAHHVDKAIEKIVTIYNSIEIERQPVLQAASVDKTYCIVPYGIYGGAEVYLENHIKKGTFKDLHLIFLAPNPLMEKLKDLVPCTRINSLTEAGNFLINSNAKKAMFYNSANAYRLLLRVKKHSSLLITEIVHSYHKWADSMHNTPRVGIDNTIAVAAIVARQWEITKFQVVPPTIDEERFKVPKKTHDGINIGIVARLSPEKNLRRAMDILTLLPQEYKMVFVGKDGGSKQDLMAYSREKKAAGRTFFRDHSEKVEEEYADFDLFLLTSLIEGTPLTILEALASSLPVVAPNVGAIKEMLKGKNAFVFEQNQANDVVASKIMEMIGKIDRSTEIIEIVDDSQPDQKTDIFFSNENTEVAKKTKTPQLKSNLAIRYK